MADREKLRLCATCMQRLERDEATFFQGRHWCAEHFRVQLGLAAHLDSDRPGDRMVLLGMLHVALALFVVVRWLSGSLF